MTFQIYNFQPSTFKLITVTPQTAGWTVEKMMNFWNDDFKLPFLKYLNNPIRQSITLPPQVYSWISTNVTKAIYNFKFDLYDKFAIVNIQPDYASVELIYLISSYI